MFRKILAALGTLALAVGLSAIAVAAPASAHHTDLSGSAACAPAGGWDVTWTLVNSENRGATVTAATNTATSTSPIAVGTVLAANPAYGSANSVSTTYVQHVTTSAPVTQAVSTTWTNGVKASKSATVSGFPTGCTTADSDATVMVTAATCLAPASLSYATHDFSTFTGGTADGTKGATSGSALTHYSVVATAATGHTFSSGLTTLTIVGDLDPQLSGASCVPAPGCIPNSSVSYSYDPLSNSGVITVADVTNSTHVLCDPFWVTATSWKYVNATVWPQMLDIVQKLGPISAPGTYAYAAAVSCGQGDIYASDVAQPNPTATLDGPSNPFPEHFLHDMGFTGPNPTWVQQDAACASVKPTVTYELGACYQGGTAPNLLSSSTLTLVFDNSASTVPVTFSVPTALDVASSVQPTPSIVRTVPPGGTVKVQTTPIASAGGSFGVIMNGVYTVTIPDATITVQPFAGCLDAKPGDPSQTNETCLAGASVGGSITVGMETGLVYSIDGPGTAHDVSPVTTATTTGLPAGNYVVTVAAAPGYTLSGASAWPVTIKIISAVCGQLPTHPLVTPSAHMTDLTCAAAGSYTLDSNAGVVWTVGGVAVNSGTYQVAAASTVVVTATPQAPGYGFDAGIPNPSTWTFTFTKPALASCGTQLVTLAYTGVSSSLQLILAGGLVLIGIGGLLFARRYYRRA